ncbi:histone-lysine N-methyltransferase eggless isoform X2 [Chrysoperla carnea]|uniref:histone-lysine N-methyltransferase eggless isoform X2 n=1 Tax=Chrysoperla carnea TaxID=189513 RepID=UPI001D05D80C|nr:histone-lysine N-methyltransferase eggless isoform X2 [Chrysoperla carnea]
METPNPSGESEKAPVESNDLDGNNVDMQINSETNQSSTVQETEAGNVKIEKPNSNENTSDKMDTSIENKSAEPMDIDLTLDDEETAAESANKKKKKVENKKNTNVIDLDDSDSDSALTIIPTIPRKKTSCINPDCLGHNENLLKASGYCLSFYKVKLNTKRTQVICKDCRDQALNNFQAMTDLAVNNEPIFNHKLPIQSDCVEINDSSSEDEYDPESLLDLSSKDLKVLKLEISQTVEEIFEKFKIKDQIQNNVGILTQEFETISDGTDDLNKIFNDLQAKIDNARNYIYENKPACQEIQGIDIDVDGVVQLRSKVAERRSSRKIQKPSTYDETEFSTATPPSDVMVPPKAPPPKTTFIPKFGTLTKEAPEINGQYYAMKSAAFGAWQLCRLLEIFPAGMIINDKPSNKVTYRVSFENIHRRTTKNMIKLITGKQLAYSTYADVRLPIGSRVIALFSENENPKAQSNYYAGIVAEPLSNTNRFRYLIFFDDGYAQYVRHENCFPIVDVSPNVWEDISLETRNYIQQYLKEYPDRPMVRLVQGQVLKTERNGKWWSARVIEVDGSLVKMSFEGDNRKEWIYRGSRRLAPLFYNNNQAILARQNKGFTTPQRKIPSSMFKRPNEPYVEYTRTIEDEDTTDVSMNTISNSNNIARAVARKSTSLPANVATKSTTHTGGTNSLPIVPFLPTAKVPGNSRVIYYTTRTGKLPGLYKHHQCGPSCRAKSQRTLAELRDYSILAKPILAGWFRETVRFGKNKREVRYITPCSRIVRNMQELHRYLRITQSEMSVDMFDFNCGIHVLTLYQIEKSIVEKKDLSNGIEYTPISVVNDIDDTFPEYMRYSNVREPTKGVNLNLNEEFLCGCDCTDDCQDKTKCACWQLTIQGTKVGKNASPDMSTGYVYKRLLDPVVTGIYECNSRCKCNVNTCLNRVVQHPLQLKLQIFKTPNRGWGIRCLHDVPRGSFICIYAGQLLTEQTANEGGINFGDEYLAELDYIEVVERLKEGYESDVVEDDIDMHDEDRKDDDDEEYNPLANPDDRDYLPHIKGGKLASEGVIGTRRSKRRSTLLMDGLMDSENTNQSTDSDKSNKKADDKMSESGSTKSGQNEDDNKKKDSANNSGEDESITISDDEDTTREKSSFIPTASIDNDADEYVPKYKSVRKMFGPDESCYIMDAKCAGNIGRFLNHSCSPNVFVQNVFVDTHDLRFPWVAFFAMSHVRAGVELTWNYNYDVGSVPGKVMYCHCGSEECRGRLL